MTWSQILRSIQSFDDDNDDKMWTQQRNSITERAKESQILLWIYQLLDEVSTTDYGNQLRDGVILCRFVELTLEHNRKVLVITYVDVSFHSYEKLNLPRKKHPFAKNERQ